MMVRGRLKLLRISLLVGFLGCDPGVVATTPVPRIPAELRLLTQLPDSSEVGVVLVQDLEVSVVDAEGRTVPNAPVTAQIAEGSGEIKFLGGSQSDADGTIRARWTLGPASGQQTAGILVQGLPPLELSVAGFSGPVLRIERDGAPIPQGETLVFADSFDLTLYVQVPKHAPTGLERVQLLQIGDDAMSRWWTGDTTVTLPQIDSIGRSLGSKLMFFRPGQRDTVQFRSLLTPAGDYNLGVFGYREVDGITKDVRPFAAFPVSVSNSDTIPPQLNLLHPSDTILNSPNDSIVMQALDHGFFAYGAGYSGTGGGCYTSGGSFGRLDHESEIIYTLREPPCAHLNTEDGYFIILHATDRAFNYTRDSIRIRIAN